MAPHSTPTRTPCPQRASVSPALALPSARIVVVMSDLATKTCVSCLGGAPPLKGEDLATLEKQVDGWKVIEDHHITRSFKFPDFREAVKFVNHIGELAEEQVRPVVLNEKVVDVVKQEKNRATELIEDFMIAANEVVARMLETNKVSSIRRVVKIASAGTGLWSLRRSKANNSPPIRTPKLNEFLIKRKVADPDHFSDLSLAVIKLMGPGEYVLERPGDPEQGQFGLAVQDYTHSTEVRKLVQVSERGDDRNDIRGESPGGRV
jgi:pterin-4a-carbinolamine dehydratase